MYLCMLTGRSIGEVLLPDIADIVWQYLRHPVQTTGNAVDGLIT